MTASSIPGSLRHASDASMRSLCQEAGPVLAPVSRILKLQDLAHLIIIHCYEDRPTAEGTPAHLAVHSYNLLVAVLLHTMKGNQACPGLNIHLLQERVRNSLDKHSRLPPLCLLGFQLLCRKASPFTIPSVASRRIAKSEGITRSSSLIMKL